MSNLGHSWTEKKPGRRSRERVKLNLDTPQDRCVHACFEPRPDFTGAVWKRSFIPTLTPTVRAIAAENEAFKKHS